MNLKIAVLPGDGIGPEVILQAKKHYMQLARCTIMNLFLKKHLWVLLQLTKQETAPEQTLNLCLNTDAVLLGAIGDPKYDNNPKAKVRPEQGLLKLRKELDCL
jgi:3-isopropylmalate dehydrogenase